MKKPILYCNSLSFLLDEKNKRLVDQCILKTTNPAIILRRKKYHENIFYGKKPFQKTARIFHEYAKKIFEEALRKDSTKKYAHTFTKAFLLSQKSTAINAAVQKNKASKNYLVINEKRPSWMNCLSEGLPQKKTKIINWSLNIEEKKQQPKKNKYSIRNWRYFLANAVSPLLPSSIWEGQFLIFKDNDLIKETAIELFKKRFKITKITAPEALNKKLRKKLFLKKIAALAQKAFLKTTQDKKISILLTKNLKHQIIAEAKNQDLYESSWIKILQKQKRPKICGVLINYPHGTDLYALRNVCARKKIPIFSFQHGVGREISVDHPKTSFFYETNASDAVFLFNQKAKQVSEKHRFCNSRCFVVGAPQIQKKIQLFSPKYDFMYVSTMLYNDGNNLFLGNEDDLGKAEIELNIIRKVLGKCPHTIFYKPYPAERYCGSDPVIDEAKKYKNITVYEGNQTFKELYGEAKVLITSRATSTLGDCLLSNKPTIFLDIKNQSSLSIDSKKHIFNACFYIDCRQKQWIGLLNKLLNKPFNEILNIIKKEKTLKNRFISQFISDLKENTAGYYAAEKISDLVLCKD